VTLRWRATDRVPRGTRVVLRLEQGASILSQVDRPPGRERYPADLWQPGEVVLERQGLTVPPDAQSGDATVVIELGDRRVPVGDVEISASTAVFDVPEMTHHVGIRFADIAELVGYDLDPGPYSSESPVVITLYWRALPGAPDADYAVFAQLLSPEGRLIAQDDSRPAGGARPTTGWLENEIVTDPHPIAFHDPYGGPATIVVGLYDPVTMERVVTDGSQDAAVLSELTIAAR
jgi:hypothetical protein